MAKLLYVQSSPRRGASESRKIADAFLDSFRTHAPDAEIDVLDLWETRLPLFDGDKAAAKMTVITGQELAGRERTAWDEIEAEFARFNAADTYLFTVPMWNAGVPWVLKHYIDTLTQPGLLFGFEPAAGYTGLAQGKTAVAIYTSGVYQPGVAKAFGSDFHSAFFDDWLRFCGIEDVHEIRFQPSLLTMDVDGDRAAAQATARELAKELAQARTRLAA
jgi:FMN-dependent NADH-azoreductase